VASVALADCDLLIRIVDDPGEARGTTFVGAARSVADQPDEDSVTFEVDDVYAGDAPASFTIDPSCHPLHGFRVGGRYLVSTGGTTRASSMDTLAWELVHGRPG